MFSGIVEEVGVVVKCERAENLCALRLRVRKILRGTKPGDSVAVDGVCLTVTGIKKDVLTFDMMRETLLKTTLGGLAPGDGVNLERALKVSDRISGHFVTGHVDEVGVIREIIHKTNYTEFQIRLNKSLARYIVPKGSVCLDGVSLTVGEVQRNFFSVYLIPFTKEVTTLGSRKKGAKINIETDILAKYVLNPGVFGIRIS